MALKFAGNVRVVRGNRQGIPTIEVTIGDVMEPWEIAEKWAAVERELERSRLDGLVAVETKREGNRFRSYTVTDTDKDVSKGRL